MSASLAVQKAIRAALVGAPPLMLLVPAANILAHPLDRLPDPYVLIGEDQEVEGDDIGRRNVLVYSTLHVWKREKGLGSVKAIAGAIRSALSSRLVAGDPGFHFAGCRVSSARFVRDPDGEHAHGIVTVETLVHEVRA